MEKWLGKIKRIKHIEIYGAVVVIAIMVLIFFSSLGGQGGATSFGSKASASGSASSAGVYTSDELRLGNILSLINGAGRVNVMKTEKGVVVIASGADDPNVRFAIMRAVQTLLNDNTMRIEILCSK